MKLLPNDFWRKTLNSFRSVEVFWGFFVNVLTQLLASISPMIVLIWRKAPTRTYRIWENGTCSPANSDGV